MLGQFNPAFLDIGLFLKIPSATGVAADTSQNMSHFVSLANKVGLVVGTSILEVKKLRVGGVKSNEITQLTSVAGVCELSPSAWTYFPTIPWEVAGHLRTGGGDGAQSNKNDAQELMFKSHVAGSLRQLVPFSFGVTGLIGSSAV